MVEPLVGWVKGPNTRGTSDIIWSCLSVVFISTWTTLHINVPPIKKSYWWRLGNKLFWMLTGLVAPEYVATLAFTELRAALLVRSSMHDLGYKNWGLGQSFFVVMGGYMFHVNDEYKPISAENFVKWQRRGTLMMLRPSVKNKHGAQSQSEDATSAKAETVEIEPIKETVPHADVPAPIDLPWISEQDVTQRGKADFLLKSIACAQVTWLLVQYVARAIQSLAISSLEALTVAYVVCALFSYGAWWKTPYDMESVVVIPIASDHELVPLLESEPFQIPFNYDPDLPLAHTPWWTYLLPCITAVMAFSCLHFLAWNAHFNTTIEKWFWRASSIMVTWFHVSFLAFSVYMQKNMKKEPTAAKLAKIVFGAEWKTLRYLVFVVKYALCIPNNVKLKKLDVWLQNKCEEGFTPGGELIPFLVSHTMFYFFARIFVLVEAFLSLRRVPADLYDTVDWTRFIPHVH
jgi:hypothetical protein